MKWQSFKAYPPKVISFLSPGTFETPIWPVEEKNLAKYLLRKSGVNLRINRIFWEVHIRAILSLLVSTIFPFLIQFSKLSRHGNSQIPIPKQFSKIRGVFKLLGGGLKFTGIQVPIL